jgi:hypothetical protein
MSDENGQEIGVNVYGDNDEDELIEDEEAAAVAPQPLEVVREEIVTVTNNSDTEDNDDLYEVVKAHSYQISRLTEIVESLQSQIMQIDQRRGSSNNKTSSIRNNRSATKTKRAKQRRKDLKERRVQRESKEFQTGIYPSISRFSISILIILNRNVSPNFLLVLLTRYGGGLR